MNARGDANRSVRMTKRRLYEAFVELLEQKPVAAITVRELTARAKISRGTFYFHYDDIFDLVRQMEQEQMDQLNALLDALLPEIGRDAPPPALTALFEYLSENNGICNVLLGPNGDAAFIVRLENIIAKRCLGYIAPGGQETPHQQYLMAFSVHGCFGCIAAWLLGGRRETTAAMADTVWQAIHSIYQAQTAEQK